MLQACITPILGAPDWKDTVVYPEFCLAFQYRGGSQGGDQNIGVRIFIWWARECRKAATRRGRRVALCSENRWRQSGGRCRAELSRLPMR
jgi:hypothetical protein